MSPATLRHTKFNCGQTPLLPPAADTGGVALTELVKPNVRGIFTEALAAHVELVLADNCLLVRANHAMARALAHADLLTGTPLFEVAHSCRLRFLVVCESV
ncbi:hypothetical protein TraAM80_07294 [Trypanosoma rangeli]|uniref:Uncharacterized protein n=1 Tax=Trypanosoma rangeli TaxID=5698 RepID=A0A3R7NDB6_TRYRA|nr:uncharacterized protein TraAM80_07294 [Trypanosoma rangeli]RNF00989.1 hypothetical protein TraAM80_07294 [Trypanosoma rangeli]|eukprot:RNF00989.1 hypothetical protein TraAM80_07294 [Trypanosoma rangeli]